MYDRVFVPLRYVAELFNADVRWDAEAQGAYIYK